MPYTMEDFIRDFVREHLHLLSPAELCEGLSPAELRAGLSPAELCAGLSLEERFAGVSPEEIAALLERAAARGASTATE